jgi:hypothetical protein
VYSANAVNSSFWKNRRFWVPTLLWLASVLAYVVLLQTGEVKYDSLLRMLTQWDGQHYLSIARDGYEKFPCPWGKEYICGNIGWFPFYPLLGRLVGQVIGPLGLDMRVAMLAVSWLALWLALLVLYRLVENKFGPRSALYSVAALLLFPSSFYFLTAFPYSVFLLLAVCVFYGLEKEKYFPIIPAVGALAVTYPSGMVVGLPLLATLIIKWKNLKPNQRWSLLFALLTICLALVLYFGYYWWRFGDFFLYQRFQSQSYYAHRPTFPFLPIVNTLISFRWDDPVFIMLSFLLIVTVAFYSRTIPVPWQVFMFGILLFTPSFGTTTCYYRHIVVAFPLYTMIGASAQSQRRRYFLIPYALVSLVLMWEIFLPYYKTGKLM